MTTSNVMGEYKMGNFLAFLAVIGALAALIAMLGKHIDGPGQMATVEEKIEFISAPGIQMDCNRNNCEGKRWP